jgi:myo-inositol 2-dehydrogenase / D-chiro-inositol 1-dehydrogenase
MSKLVRVGLVGAGWMGSMLLRRLSERADVEVRTLCEVDAKRGRTVLDELGLTDTRLVNDYGQVVGDPEINAVWLVSPNTYHGPQSIAALEVGKHVFCEKPSATSFADHVQQLALARAHPDLKTFVDYLMYFDDFETRLRDTIGRGELGTITQIQINYRHPVNISGDKAWKLRRDVMGDAIGMGIIHSVSAILFAMESQARPVSVYATSMPAQTRGFEADPIWNIQIRFDNGACGFVFGNIDSVNGYDAYHSVYGTRGAMIFDSLLDRPQKVRMWRDGLADGRWVYPLDSTRCHEEGVEPWPEDTSTPDSGDVIKHQTSECVGHFINCILQDHQSPLSFVNSSVVAEVGWAAQISSALGQPVPLPLDYEQAQQMFSKQTISQGS